MKSLIKDVLPLLTLLLIVEAFNTFGWPLAVAIVGAIIIVSDVNNTQPGE